MKISGETIKGVTDFVQGAGRTLEPVGKASSILLGAVGHRLEEGGVGRKARLVEFKEAKYENAEDWTAAEDGSITVHASVVKGGATVDVPEPIEFVHFGRVYRDSSKRFAAGEIDDTMTAASPAATKPNNLATIDVAARGLMYRGALMRETVLLGGFIRAQMDALIAEEKSKGVVGVLATLAADLTGSAGGTEDKPSPVDLNPHLKKVIDAGKALNRATIDYPTIHQAGIDLHTARRAYREYLVAELEKRHAPAKTPKPGGGILNEQTPHVNDMLARGSEWFGGKKKEEGEEKKQDAVPRLTALIPPKAQDFLSLVQKISFKAWDVYAALNYEYAVRLEPIIESQCRAISIHAIQHKVRPIFPVWLMEPQTIPELPQDIAERIFGKIEKPVDDKAALGLGKKANELVAPVTKPIVDELKAFDQKVGVRKTLDFLSRPDRYTPGRPFLDDIFLVPEDTDAPEVPDGTRRARVGWSSGLGQMAVDALKGALKIDEMPAFLEWGVSKVSTVSAEFMRGIFCRVMTMKDDEVVGEDELIEAAKRHLVGNVVESLLGGVKFVDDLRMAKIDIPIAEVAFSVDALIGRAKEFAAQNLDQFVDPVVRYAVRDLHGAIFAYRKTALENGALTMEVHLAQLPVLFARLFRNIFFPLWDKVIEKTLEGLTASLSPRIHDAAAQILKAKDQVDGVRRHITKTLAALDTLPGKLPDAGFSLSDPKGSVKKLKDDWNPIVKKAKDAYDDADLEETQDIPARDELITVFPLQKRIRIAAALAVTPEHLKKVKPNLKWAPRVPDAAKQLPPATEEPKTTAPGTQPPSASGPPSTASGPPSSPPSYAQPTAYAASSDAYGPSSSPGSYGYPPPSQGYPQAPPSQGYYVAQQNVAPPGAPSAEKTEEFSVSPDLQKLAQADMEETIDLPNLPASALPPFLGSKKG